MKGKKRLIALLLSFLMVLSQMSVATFALDTVADENSDQTVEEQAVEETQPEADVKVAAVETEPAATEPAAEETATEPEAAKPAATEPAKAEPAKAEEKKAEPEKAEAREEAFDQSQTVDGVTVNVSAAKGVFPAGSKLSVSKVAVPDAVDTSDAEAAYAFDISILANGEKIQPDGNAEVSFTTAEVADYDTAVYHMDDGAQQMNVSESGDTATVTTGGFSVYTVVFKRTDPNFDDRTANLELKTGQTKEIGEIVESISGFKFYDDTGNYHITEGSVVSGSDVVEYAANTEDPKKSTIKILKAGNAVLRVLIRKNDISDTTIYSVNANITSTLSKYEVAFDLNGGTLEGLENPQLVDVTGEKAGKVTDPGDPTKAGCTFEGWFAPDAEEAFDFANATISDDITLTAKYHTWAFEKTNMAEGKVYCTDEGCQYHEGFVVRLNAEDVYHVKDVEDVTVDDPSSEEGYPKDLYTVGKIQYYDGKITKEEDFDGKETVPESTVKNKEGFYTARVIIGQVDVEKSTSLFKPFEVVSAGPEPTDNLVYKDGKAVIADDGLLPEGTSAVVRYKHPITGKYLSKEELLNDGSIPAGEHVINYVVLPSADYEDPEDERIGVGDVSVYIAPRQFTITYDLNGGKLNGQTGKVSMKVDEGTVITLPAPTRDGYTFDYWEGSRYNAGDKYTVTGDHTFKAVWKTSGSGKKGNGVNTGDTNDIAGLLALMIASVGALGAIGYRRRKEDQ